jgi:hypothetical protein
MTAFPIISPCVYREGGHPKGATPRRGPEGVPRRKSQPVADHLFPRCGHAMFEAEGEDDVVIVGCPNGMDFELVHADATVTITATDGRRYNIDDGEWRDSVCEFADAVQAFYDASSPKAIEDEDSGKGFQRFWTEWSRRKSQARNAA